MTRLFDAPRHLVFEAMTKPEHVKRWWGHLGEGYSVPVCEIDLRPGGAWRFVSRHPKGEIAFYGEYREMKISLRNCSGRDLRILLAGGMDLRTRSHRGAMVPTAREGGHRAALCVCRSREQSGRQRNMGVGSEGGMRGHRRFVIDERDRADSLSREVGIRPRTSEWHSYSRTSP